MSVFRYETDETTSTEEEKLAPPQTGAEALHLARRIVAYGALVDSVDPRARSKAGANTLDLIVFFSADTTHVDPDETQRSFAMSKREGLRTKGWVFAGEDEDGRLLVVAVFDVPQKPKRTATMEILTVIRTGN